MLRVAILLDSENVSAWVADIVNAIGHHKQVQWAVVIYNKALPSSNRSNLLYKIFRRIDHALLPGRPEVFAKVKPIFPAGTPVIALAPKKKGIKNLFEEADIETIAQYKPDLLLRFGFGILSGDILSLPRYGVWSLHHGDNDHYRGGPPGFWEWFGKVPITGAVLQCLTEELDGGKCLAKTYTKTDYTSFSRNQAMIFSKGIDLMADAVIKLANTGKQEISHEAPLMYSSPIYKDPGFSDSLRSLWKLFSRALPVPIEKVFYREQWVLFFSLSNRSFPLNFRKFKAMIPPPDRDWADPFVVSQNGKHYLFIEELIYQKRKGHISCLVLDGKGRVETIATILEQPFHLSYPFIFQHNSVWYMVPESAANKTVDLYECIAFPFQWKFKRTLLSVMEAFDSTIHFHNNRYWLFCTIRKRTGASANDDLHIYSTANFLEGNWEAHPMNPVVVDPRTARPAGKIFTDGNYIYRPSQICSPRYGSGVSLNRIELLNESEYIEVPVSKAGPQWRTDLLTMHSLNFTEGITVTDGQLKRPKMDRAGIQPIRILFVIDSLSTGGAEYSTLRLAGWLKKEKLWDVKLVYLRDRTPSYNLADFDLDTCSLRLSGKSWLQKTIKLYQLIRQWNPQIVHSVLLYANFFCRPIRLVNGGSIFIESLVNRTYDESRFKDPKVNNRGLKFFRLADRLSQKIGVDYFHAVTQDIANHFAEHTGTPAARVNVVYRGRQPISVNHSKDQHQLVANNPIVFLTAGRHEYQKGHIHLLNAYKHFIEEYAGQSMLLVAGREGSETVQLQKFIADNGLTQTVQLLGHRNDLRSLMATADVFVLPSLFEGIGGVLIEAEAAGLPIICTNLDGLKEVVEENSNALTVAPSQVQPLKEAMLRLANDLALRMSFGKRSLQIFSSRFDEVKSHENMVGFYLDKVYSKRGYDFKKK